MDESTFWLWLLVAWWSGVLAGVLATLVVLWWRRRRRFTSEPAKAAIGTPNAKAWQDFDELHRERFEAQRRHHYRET